VRLGEGSDTLAADRPDQMVVVVAAAAAATAVDAVADVG